MIIDLCTTNDKKRPGNKGRDTDYINIGKEKVSKDVDMKKGFLETYGWQMDT